MIRLPRLFLPTLISATLAFAQQPPVSADMSLEGRVTDAGGDPLRKVTLTLQGLPTAAVSLQPSYRATSDAEGRFSFEGIEAGDYSLSAERAGYLRKMYRASPRETSARLTLTAGQHLTEIDLAMTRAATISGSVLDEDGDPVAGMLVSLLQPRYQNGARILESKRSAITDESGKYQMIEDLEPDEYYLSAGGGREAAFSMLGMRAVNGPAGYHEAKPGQMPEYYAATFYPSEIDESSAAAVRLVAGVDLPGIDIHLRKTPAFQIKGKVTGTIPGHPLEQLHIALVSSARSPTLRLTDGTRAHIGANGSFDFPNLSFPPGDYYLVATQGPVTLLARQRLTVAKQDIDDAVLNLQPLEELHGTVAIEGAPGDLSWLREGNPPLATILQVSLLAKNGPLLNNVRGKIKDDGSFVLADIAPGVYGVRLTPIPSGTYVKSIELGSQDALTTGINVNRQTAGAPIEITLSRAVGQITGVMQTDRGVPTGGTVTLVSDLPESGGGISMMSGVGDNGRFSLPPVPPGTYRLYAWEDLETAQHYDPGFLKPYESKSVQVTVTENGRAQVVLNQIPAAPEMHNK